MASKRLKRSYRKKSIKDLSDLIGLKFDITDIPTDSFTLLETDNRSPQVKSYELKLQELECGLYQKAIVHVSGENKNLVLEQIKTSLDEIDRLKDLIERIYAALGNDDNGKKEMTQVEINELKSGLGWQGRSWMDVERFSNPIYLMDNSITLYDIEWY